MTNKAYFFLAKIRCKVQLSLLQIDILSRLILKKLLSKELKPFTLTCFLMKSRIYPVDFYVINYEKTLYVVCLAIIMQRKDSAERIGETSQIVAHTR